MRFHIGQFDYGHGWEMTIEHVGYRHGVRWITRRRVKRPSYRMMVAAKKKLRAALGRRHNRGTRKRL